MNMIFFLAFLIISSLIPILAFFISGIDRIEAPQ